MKKDLTIVRKFAVDSMHLARCVDNKFKFYLYSKDPLYSELTKSTTTLGDYLSECLVGFLFARFKGRKVRSELSASLLSKFRSSNRYREQSFE